MSSCQDSVWDDNNGWQGKPPGCYCQAPVFHSNKCVTVCVEWYVFVCPCVHVCVSTLWGQGDVTNVIMLVWDCRHQRGARGERQRCDSAIVLPACSAQENALHDLIKMAHFWGCCFSRPEMNHLKRSINMKWKRKSPRFFWGFFLISHLSIGSEVHHRINMCFLCNRKSVHKKKCKNKSFCLSSCHFFFRNFFTVSVVLLTLLPCREGGGSSVREGRREGPQALYTSHRGKCVAREVYKVLPLFTRLHNRINSLAINAGGNIWPSVLTRLALPVKRGHERQLTAQGRLHLCI